MPEAADAERVFRDMASQGNKLIFGTTFGYMEPMLKVAADIKDVKFEHATGYKTADNMRTYDTRTYEGAYMAGVIAGGMTKTNTLGVVGSIPIPEVIRNINSFTLGAQRVNPKVDDQGGVGQRVVRSAEGDRGRAVADQRRRRRADAEHRLAGRAADRREGRQVRLRLGQRHDRLRPEGAPRLERHQLGAVLHQGDAGRAGRHLEDRPDTWWGVKEGAIDLVSISDEVPADLKAKLDKVKAGLKDGSFVIWKGPIVDQDGKEVVAKDAVPTTSS